MKKSLILSGVALAVVAAVPFAIAAMPMGMGDTWKRADVEAKVKEHFAKADANKDGAVTRDEIQAAGAMMRRDKFGAMFEKLDGNKDGTISRDEFMAGHSGPMQDHDEGDGAMSADQDGAKHHGRMHHGGMKAGMMTRGMMGSRLFDRADADKDGKLTLAEANGAALAWFDRLDTNKDGQVTSQERIAHWQTRRAERKAG